MLDCHPPAGGFARKIAFYECRILMLAMVAAWRWDRNDQLPNGQREARRFLSELRAARSGATFSTPLSHWTDTYISRLVEAAIAIDVGLVLENRHAGADGIRVARPNLAGEAE